MFQIKSYCIEHVSDTKKIDNGKVENCLKERVEKLKMLHSKCYDVGIALLPHYDVFIIVMIFSPLLLTFCVLQVQNSRHCQLSAGSGLLK